MINAFRLEPSSPIVTVLYGEAAKGTSINRLVGVIRRELQLPSASLRTDYAGLKAGIYVLAHLDPDIRSRLESIGVINLKEITINTSSYIMKYMIAHALSKKMSSCNGIKRYRSESPATYTFYFTTPIYTSKMGLFSFHEGFEYRIEHIPIYDVDRLYMVLDYRLVIRPTITFRELIEMLKERRVDLAVLRGLPCKVIHIIEQKELLHPGFVCDFDEAQNTIIVHIHDSGRCERVSIKPEQALLFSNYRWYKRILQCIGEDIIDLENARGRYSYLRDKGKALLDAPKRRWEVIRKLADRIKRSIFPLKVGDVVYYLNTEEYLYLMGEI